MWTVRAMGGIVMISMGSVRFHAPGRRYSASPVRAWNDFHVGIALVAIVVVLLILGQLWPWTRYRLMAAGAGGCNMVFFTGRWVMAGSHLAPAAAVLTGFLLLAAGAVISWCKPALLGMTGFAEPAETPRPPGSKQA